jgi:hypothetical protein
MREDFWDDAEEGSFLRSARLSVPVCMKKIRETVTRFHYQMNNVLNDYVG